ncbi:hypothetical protein SK128_008541 [Halocaridina rubra]|uniref:Uncharacterized protein n=1 Tax=Halocaridina rubra TaxID=373956 RepID=A0AAN8X6Z3_HALRR
MNCERSPGERSSIPDTATAQEDSFPSPENCQQTILEEVFTSDYDVTEEGVR